MSDKKIILTVRATQDGVYGNYLYKGPIDSDQGYTPGEVFQIDATPYVVKDHKGNPVFVVDESGNKIPILDVKGNPKKDEKVKKLFKVQMATFFSKEWMERVEDDTEVTYPDRPAWSIPEAYRIKKSKPVRTVALPGDLMETAGIAVPDAVNEALSGAEAQRLEEVI